MQDELDLLENAGDRVTVVVDEEEPTAAAEQDHHHHASSTTCWLCLNSAHEEAKRMHRFVLQNISSISADCMAQMIVEHLSTVDPGGAGLSVRDIRRHIHGGHLIHPSLQMAFTLRSLIELRDTIHKMIIVEDEDGVRTVDVRNMATYLKVISEIVQVYKTGDVGRLMFAADESVGVAPAAAGARAGRGGNDN
jgi:hypothetical protein